MRAVPRRKSLFLGRAIDVSPYSSVVASLMEVPFGLDRASREGSSSWGKRLGDKVRQLAFRPFPLIPLLGLQFIDVRNPDFYGAIVQDEPLPATGSTEAWSSWAASPPLVIARKAMRLATYR